MLVLMAPNHIIFSLFHNNNAVNPLPLQQKINAVSPSCIEELRAMQVEAVTTVDGCRIHSSPAY